MLLFDVPDLKNPDTHPSHLGWAVLDPAVLVNLPGGHLVWGLQSWTLSPFTVLKNPALHGLHNGSSLLSRYFPTGHTSAEIWHSIENANASNSMMRVSIDVGPNRASPVVYFLWANTPRVVFF